MRYCSVRGQHGQIHNDVSLEWNEVSQEDLLESVGNLVTIHSLAYLKRGHHLENFAAKIRVNAIKVGDKWWEIHDMPRAHVDLTEIPHLHGAQEITPFDFAILFDQGHLYYQGMDGSTLFFYPKIGKLVIEEDTELGIDKDFRFVCVHKRTDKIGKTMLKVIASYEYFDFRSKMSRKCCRMP